mmetsp:Transcript_594/g.1386  ORF Transcript_594/g.1386 Transcript_594/m.1386 type:complete len:110 (+) Transcript_594:131-460(+)
MRGNTENTERRAPFLGRVLTGTLLLALVLAGTAQCAPRQRALLDAHEGGDGTAAANVTAGNDTMAANGTEADDTRRELDGINQITGGPDLGGGLSVDPGSGGIVATGRK